MGKHKLQSLKPQFRWTGSQLSARALLNTKLIIVGSIRYWLRACDAQLSLCQFITCIKSRHAPVKPKSFEKRFLETNCRITCDCSVIN
jgi:hypothetical protein